MVMRVKVYQIFVYKKVQEGTTTEVRVTNSIARYNFAHKLTRV